MHETLLFTSVYTVSEILSQLMINGKIVKIPNGISEYYLIEITVVLSFNVALSAAPLVCLQNKKRGRR